MIKVITYGTYDMLHYGHIRLLERAKALGDYLIVGVTADDFDKVRGKINSKQSLMDRVEAVRKTGLADKIIIEEYEGQKIDDIKKYDIDIFTVGSDWIGKFDYLNEYCKVIYLERTQGISSSEVRAMENEIKFGVIGETAMAAKVASESQYVNGLNIQKILTKESSFFSAYSLDSDLYCEVSLHDFLKDVDAVYIGSHPGKHYEQIKTAIEMGKHVLFESPLCMNTDQALELIALAKENHIILMESIKTAYATAYNRMLLLVKSGRIGEVVSVDATCTSLLNFENEQEIDKTIVWNGICAWGPTCILPVLQILGLQYENKYIISKLADDHSEIKFDKFTKIDFVYPHAVASIKVGTGVKSEGEMIISGTKGYLYIPAPWWKTDYFEIRYENPSENRRFFYQLAGEGIRNELVAFTKAIADGKKEIYSDISDDMTIKITEIIEDFETNKDVTLI